MEKDFSLSDGVFSRPFVPGVNGLPRERQHRHSGGTGGQPSLLDIRQEPAGLLRIKSERELVVTECSSAPAIPLKMEPYYTFPNMEAAAASGGA